MKVMTRNDCVGRIARTAAAAAKRKKCTAGLCPPSREEGHEALFHALSSGAFCVKPQDNAARHVGRASGRQPVESRRSGFRVRSG
ncbi:hypothetical protein AU490_15615 [Lonsdalea populi]|uniref:Uncharacterized protein n=1 Tax=Lonsdalea populi TaxID=1172565 RepID=A0A3N0UU11_9GAMM|nr:hypothetical protein AU486_09010 [Lonsdalea quercina]RAT25345.1 hypothetical protein AU490_15615 [Lonsdalea populi]RAT38436.1 hypothetical protein AU491_04040 [Lonsdalea populi]RAT49717.1 hypothetical protein AU496_00610 [Lonsdalea populi]RAT52138.1 hypothetical protein AU497_09055 [Lonsdalea populi]